MRTGTPPTATRPRLPGARLAAALAGALVLHGWVLHALWPEPGSARVPHPMNPVVLPWQPVTYPPIPSSPPPEVAIADPPRDATGADPARLARARSGATAVRPDGRAGPEATPRPGTAHAPGEPAPFSPANEVAPEPSPPRLAQALPPAQGTAATSRTSPTERPAEPASREPGRPWATPATRLPPAFQWTFAVRRGPQQGLADLRWQPQGEQYELSLETRGVGPQGFGQVSRGGFDAAGVAPDRFVDRRRGRDRLAVNFDRSAGLLTFSGPQVRHPLVSGAQDRLSWMVQLAAVLEADPVRWGVGERLPLFVAGPRGDADTWWFQIQAREPVELADGSRREALRVTREPTRPYDTRVDAWLDPQRHHLPLRLRLQPIPAGETVEYSLLRESGSVGVP